MESALWFNTWHDKMSPVQALPKIGDDLVDIQIEFIQHSRNVDKYDAIHVSNVLSRTK